MLSLLFFTIFIGCLGFLYSEGMWSNAIRLVNVIIAGLLAMNFWEPLAGWFYGYETTFTYFWDFLALWCVFVAAFAVLRAITDATSKVNVRFLKIVDRIGGLVFAACVGWVMVCFTATTLHTAPLSREFLSGAFVPEARAASILSPEMQWLGFTQKMSAGPFARSIPADERDQEKYIFDPRGEFVPKYASRRTNLENYANKYSALRVLPAEKDQHN